MNKTEQDILYLVSCALHQTKPNVEGMDLGKISEIAMSHTISFMVCMALESAGIKVDVLMDQKNKAIRKVMLLDSEREKIFSLFKSAGIWYLPLKGVILKEMYPVYGMRQMADNDILFDSTYRNEVKDIFLSLGYEIESYNKGNHDVYLKSPIYNYEMHVSLFDKSIPGFLEYYTQLEKKYADQGLNRHMDVNDAYVYIIAHAYKHFIFSGTGIRTLIDIYVYNESCSLDPNYIYEQCKILGIQDYEKEAREMAYKLFDVPTNDFSSLTKEELEYVEYYFISGTYGTAKQRMKNEIHKFELEGFKHAKAKYVFRRLFPEASWFKNHSKFLETYPIFIPFYAVFRIITKIFTSWKKWTSELKNILFMD